MLNLKKFDEAIECYNQAIQLEPKITLFTENKAKTFNSKGLLKIDENEFDEAIELFNLAIETNPKQSNYLMNKGRLQNYKIK